MTVLMLGSRTYQPLSDVNAELADPGIQTVAFGVSPVALRAESLGARRKPLEANRATLLEMAAQPGAEVVLFVARDAVTKQPTEGMAGIQRLLADKHIPFRVVSSPLPGRVCEIITTLNAAVEKALAASANARRVALTSRALAAATAATDARDEYERKLTDGMHLFPNDDAATAKWLRWEACYKALCDAITNAKAVLA